MQLALVPRRPERAGRPGVAGARGASEDPRAPEALDGAETAETAETIAHDPVRSVTEEALRGSEAARVRSFATVGATLACAALLVEVVVIVSGHSTHRYPLVVRAFMATLAGFGALCVVVRRRAESGTVPHRLVTALAIAGLLLALVAQLFMGPFSAAVVVPMLGLSFFGLSDFSGTTGRAWSFGVVASLAYALLVAARVLPDVGLFSSDGATSPARFSMALVIAACSTVAFRQMRAARQATEAAIARAAEAVREVRQRDAQLVEANRDLYVLRGRNVGRYTDQVAGGFRLAEIIGRGAMGDVYAAAHTRTGAAGAVKVLNTTSREEASVVDRFAREAEIMTSLRGPNLVPVYEVGALPDGTPFIAMERLVGSDLAAILRREPRLSLARVLQLVGEVAEGLAVAHAAGVVHRDLKPQNLFLATKGERETWTVLDFGIARAGDSTGTLTGGELVGTPGYMAPELLVGERGDARGDVFSLGAVVYRALTGHAPFETGTTVAALMSSLNAAPRRPSAHVPGLPPDVERVLALALAKDPSRRFASVRAFAEALRQAAAGALDPRLRRAADAACAWSEDDETWTRFR